MKRVSFTPEQFKHLLPRAPFYASARSVCTGPCIGCIALYFRMISHGNFLPECVFAVLVAATSPKLLPAAVLWFMYTSELRRFHVKNNSSNVEQGWICFRLHLQVQCNFTCKPIDTVIST